MPTTTTITTPVAPRRTGSLAEAMAFDQLASSQPEVWAQTLTGELEQARQCDAKAAVCRCRAARPLLAAVTRPVWRWLPDTVVSDWLLGVPCWLDPDTAEVPAHLRVW